MSKSKPISKLKYLEAQRSFFAKDKLLDPDFKIIVLYELDAEIKRERELKTNE